MTLEGFVKIPEYPAYLVSKEGEIYSTLSNKLLSPAISSRGYKHFAAKDLETGKFTWLLVHRVVCRVFGNLPSLSSDLEVDHVDTNKLNNNDTNLIAMDSKDHMLKTLSDLGHSLRNNRCSKCGSPIGNRNTLCRGCTRRNDISIEDIEYWVTNHSWTRAAKELNISDNGLRRVYKRLTGLDPKSLKRIK